MTTDTPGSEAHDLVDATRRAALRAARRMMRFIPGIDALANDASDYQALFHTEAWLAGVKFLERAQPSPERDLAHEQMLYSLKSAWNETAKFDRARRFRMRQLPSMLDIEEVEVPDEEMDLEAQQNARETLEFLQGQFSPEEWDALTRVALCDGAPVEAWSEEQDGPLTSFYKRVMRLREKARTLLQEMGG